MVNYSRISGSQFPDKIIEPVGYLDATDEIAEQINTIKQLQAQGKYDEVIETIKAYDLKKYILSSDVINFIEEELRNVEVYCKSTQQQIFYQYNSPIDYASESDVWIGGGQV